MGLMCLSLTRALTLTVIKAYSYSTILVPSLVIAPAFFAGEVKFGVISQAGMAFGAVYSGLALIITNFSDRMCTLCR